MDAQWKAAAARAPSNIKFADMDGDTIESIRDSMNITAYPTLLLMENGV